MCFPGTTLGHIPTAKGRNSKEERSKRCQVSPTTRQTPQDLRLKNHPLQPSALPRKHNQPNGSVRGPSSPRQLSGPGVRCPGLRAALSFQTWAEISWTLSPCALHSSRDSTAVCCLHIPEWRPPQPRATRGAAEEWRQAAPAEVPQAPAAPPSRGMAALWISEPPLPSSWRVAPGFCGDG